MEDEKERTIPTIYLLLVDGEETDTHPTTIEGSGGQKQSGHENELPIWNECSRGGHRLPQLLMSWQYPFWARVVGIFGLIVWFGPALLIPVFSPVLALPVTVMLEPITKEMELETTLTLQARQLEAPTLSQTKTKATTGRGYQPARKASGTVTLYNALTTAQYITAGTILTASSGVEVMLDQDVTIPAGERVTNGQASVPAQARLSGPGGNIEPFEINGPCCAAYILAANPTAFTGGTDELHYQVVAQSDIDQTAKELETSSQGSVDAIFEALLQPGETMLTSACEPSISADKRIGQEATSIRVTLELQCRAFAYNTANLQQAIEQRVDQQAPHQLGASYRRVGACELETLHI